MPPITHSCADAPLVHIDKTSEAFRSSFQVLISLLNQNAFDVQKTLEHLSDMQCRYEDLGARLDAITVHCSDFERQSYPPLRLIPYLVASYLAHHQSAPYRSLFEASKPNALRFDQQELFQLIDLFLSLGVQLDHPFSSDSLSQPTPLAIHLAAACNDTGLLSFLISRGSPADLICNGVSPLRSAVEGHAVDAVQFLLEHGASPDLCTSREFRPVSWSAASKTQLETLQLLFEYGAHLNYQLFETAPFMGLVATAIRYGSSSIDESLDLKDLDLIRWLIDQGANIHGVDSEGNTAFHEAAKLGRTDILALLLEHGALLNVQNKKGETELHLAASRKPSTIAPILFLLSKGSDCGIKNIVGVTPYKVARTWGWHEAVACFKAVEEQLSLSEVIPSAAALPPSTTDASVIDSQHMADLSPLTATPSSSPSKARKTL